MADTNSPLNSVLGACLLAGAGGMLDAIVFLNHNHVFACAMTGNVIFMAIAALAHDWMQVGRHGALLIAFFFGIAGSMFLRTRHLPIVGITLQIATLLVLGALPLTFSPVLVTSAVGFSASLQAATFRKLNKSSYNSTFLTGNLRSVAESTYLLLFPGESAKLAVDEKVEPLDEQSSQVAALTLVCLAFLAGALIGAYFAPRLGNRSLWIPMAPLTAALVIAWRHRSAMETTRAEA